MASCIRCRKPIDPSDSIQHDDNKCKHWTHIDCEDGKEYDDLDFDQCDACLGKIDASAPLLPDIEPKPKDGRDYVADPLEPGLFANIRRSIPSVFNRNLTKITSTDPHYLLRQGPHECPVDWMMREKQLGLWHMLKAGVTIDDFANNGYTWDQLKLYEDLGKEGRERCVMALQALQTTPEHMRSFPTVVPVKSMGLLGRDLKDYFGLHFPQDGPALKSMTTEDWTATDCLRMGLRMEDLLDMGMVYVEQYLNLSPTADDEKALGATLPQIQALQKNSNDLAAHVAQQDQPQQSTPLPYVSPQPYRQPQQLPPIQPRYVVAQSQRTHNPYIESATQVHRQMLSTRYNQRGVHELNDE